MPTDITNYVGNAGLFVRWTQSSPSFEVYDRTKKRFVLADEFNEAGRFNFFEHVKDIVNITLNYGIIRAVKYDLDATTAHAAEFLHDLSILRQD